MATDGTHIALAPKVTLLSHTPDPEIVCAVAAKICHEPDDYQTETGKFLDMAGMVGWLKAKPEHVTKVLKLIKDRGEFSVVEHAVWTFYIEEVSRALSHQLVRHRIASYSQQSQRFVSMDRPTFVMPIECRGKPEQERAFTAAMERAWEEYARLEKSGLVRGDARFVLPNACTTKIIVTMNTRSLYNFFNLRIDVHSQWEIRQLASEMLRVVKGVAPLLFDFYDNCPNCGAVTKVMDFKPHPLKIRCECEKRDVAAAAVVDN